MPSDPIQFDVNGLYILLSDLGAERQFHWGIYLALSAEHGRVYHLINNIATDGNWEYDTHLSYGVPKSKTLLVAEKIAVMDPVLHEPLGDRLATVSATPPVTCRIWLKRALHDLDDEGFIKLTGTVDAIEMDLETSATENKYRGIRTVEQSRLSIA
ncbi:hypothetical protein BJX76DRAFT_357692 [Aspergillus varians]